MTNKRKILFFLLTGLSFSFASPEGNAGDPCVRKTFKTELVKKACAEGGQKQAKKAMKAFTSRAKADNASLKCSTCHSKMKGDFPLKKSAVSLFHRLGGK